MVRFMEAWMKFPEQVLGAMRRSHAAGAIHSCLAIRRRALLVPGLPQTLEIRPWIPARMIL